MLEESKVLNSIPIEGQLYFLIGSARCGKSTIANEWVMAVTELIWVEYSFVTIGSNRSAKMTNELSTLKYM